VVAECRDRSRKDAVAVAADLSGLEATERVVREVKERCGRIDILVNNAGAIRGGEFLKIPDAQWMGDWNLKLLGYIRMARAVLPLMQAQGGGRICNVVGAAGRNPAPNYLTGGAANAQSERSDVTAVPAMGVIAEALTALVVADAFLEKFGGDSLGEIGRNFTAYLQNLAARWGALSP